MKKYDWKNEYNPIRRTANAFERRTFERWQTAFRPN